MTFRLCCCLEAMACVVKYSEIFGGEATSARGRQLLAVLQLRGLGDHRPRISAGRSEARAGFISSITSPTEPLEQISRRIFQASEEILISLQYSSDTSK